MYCYYPNLIGYGRILFLFLAGYCHSINEPFAAVALYLLSMGLDAIDGTIARYCNQSSAFGAQLDMLTDRMTTTCLYCVLIQLYPLYWYLSALFIMLDIVSHWLHMMSKLDGGNRSHKTGKYKFLKLYYEQKYVMLVLCIGQELLLIAFYLNDAYALDSTDVLGQLVFWILLVLFALKQYANVLQMMEAGQYYAAKDNQVATSKQDVPSEFSG